MKDNPCMRWIGLLTLAGFGLGAFWDGFYAPGQQLMAVALVAVFALATGRRLRLVPLELLALLLLLLGLLTSLMAPVAAGVAAHGMAVVAGWILAWTSGRALLEWSLARKKAGLVEGYLARFWAVMATLIAFAGIGLISLLPPHHSGRLASFLGYPIAVGLLGLLGLAGSLPDLAHGRRWGGLWAMGSALALLLSGSRGVWAVAFMLVIYLGWARTDLLRRALPRLSLAVAVALTTALWAAPAIADRAEPTLRLIGLISLLTLLLLDSFQPMRWVRWGGLLLTGLVAGLAPGWGWLLGRATALPLTEGSSVERLTFLGDGLALAAKLPWGAGYRSWSALHLQAASYGYYSTEVHSGPLDLALAFGWAGGLAFLLLVAHLLRSLRAGRQWSPERLVVMAGVGALAIHALLDWDLSYGFFAFPLWFGFGLVGAAGGFTARRIRWPFGLTVMLAAAALAASALLGAGDLFTQRAGESLERKEAQMGLRYAGAAVALSPWNDLAHARLAQAQTELRLGVEALDSLAQARRLGPREPWYAQMEARELARQGRLRESAAAWREAVRLWPWQVSAYEEALLAHLALIERAELAADLGLVQELAESGATVLATLAHQKSQEPPDAPRKGMEIETAVIQQARQEIGRRLGH